MKLSVQLYSLRDAGDLEELLAATEPAPKAKIEDYKGVLALAKITLEQSYKLRGVQI